MKSAAKQVRLTIAMPVFNGGAHLAMAVESIVRQTFTDWELLIIDDGSTDGALDALADLHDDRVRISRDGANRGLAIRLNEAIAMAKGHFFARMDSDDVSFPERLARQVAALESDPSIYLIATRAVTIDDANQIVGLFPFSLTHTEICARPWRGFLFPHPTWMGKLDWFQRHGYSVPAAYLSEDQELLLRTYRESKFATVDAILFAYRVRSRADWVKVAKTRKAMFAVQRREFAKAGQWHYLALAALAYLIKSGRDVVRQLFRMPFYPSQAISSAGIAREWNNVVSGLTPSRMGNIK